MAEPSCDVPSQAGSGHGHSPQAGQSTRLGVHCSGNMFQTEPGPLPQPFSFAAGQINGLCTLPDPCVSKGWWLRKQVQTSPPEDKKLSNCLKDPCNVNALKCVHCQGLFNWENPQSANHTPLKKSKPQNATEFSRKLWGLSLGLLSLRYDNSFGRSVVKNTLLLSNMPQASRWISIRWTLTRTS